MYEVMLLLGGSSVLAVGVFHTAGSMAQGERGSPGWVSCRCQVARRQEPWKHEGYSQASRSTEGPKTAEETEEPCDAKARDA